MLKLILSAVLLVSCNGFLLPGGGPQPGDMMTKPLDYSQMKFTYFDVRGRGEITRLLFAAAKKPLNERRVQFSEWPALKPNTPFGQLPTLNISGQIFSQSLAIQAFFAREFGFYGMNNIEDMTIDMVALAREDLLIQEGKVNNADNATKPAKEANLLNNLYPMYFGAIEKGLNDNDMKSGWLIRDQMTLADVVIYEGTQNCFQHVPQVLDNYPAIKALRAKFEMLDGVKEYLAKRGTLPQ